MGIGRRAVVVAVLSTLIASVSPIVGGTGASASPTPCSDTYRQPGWIVSENQLQGTTSWKIPSTQLGGIEGYADHVSAQCGDVVRLHVSTAAPYFYVLAYRMGYYGGAGARLIWQSGLHAGGLRQVPGPAPAPNTNMIEASWPTSISITVDGRWPPGDYLLKLVTDDKQHARYVPLTIRDDLSTAALAIQNDVTTWQAYNDWGGYSQYRGPNGFSDRSRVTSFDRPYHYNSQTSGGAGDGEFLLYDYPLVSFAEQRGLDVTYWTDIDLHERPQLLLNHRALITASHDEYWSTTMRNAVENARANGINVAFFGADDVHWVTRFGASPLGSDRRQIVYKNAQEDPLYGVDNSNVTVKFRDAPISNPESKLIGEMSECSPVHADMVVSDASSWIFTGTGLSNGSVLPSMVGYEYDRVIPGAPAPAGLNIVAHSPLTCGSKSSFSDMTYYSAPSGAGVFASGTITWLCVLTASCKQVTGNAGNQGVVQKITSNILTVFARGPAGPSPTP
ncbi:MAG: hypothetical protein M3290_02780 [Actinomycetota bacterium]|nr:hypothetical protein [Actinomycetota bacterium]